MDTDKLIELARRGGWRVSRTSKGHLKFQHSTVPVTVFASGTASDHRSHMNAYKKMGRVLRRAEQRIAS